MKLSKIYSNKPFNTVRFQDGLNLILGKVKDRSNKDEDSHNLGKTSLITLIDFLLLKGVTKGHIFKKNIEKFSGHIFFLEIKLNSGKYLTIKRPVSSNTKISFKTHTSKHQDFTTETDWDKKELPFKKSKEYLNKKLAFDILKNWDYRKSITYFLRNQYDYKDVFQLSKFSRGKDVNWKPFMFDLLGFDGEMPREKYELEQEKKDIENLIDEFKDKFSVSPEEIDKLKGAIELRREEHTKLTNRIDKFSFYSQERDLNRELVEEIEEDISELNSIEYELKYEIERLQDSINDDINFDLDEVEEIFKQTKINFPDQLKKNYEELVEFNKEITSERNEQIFSRLQELKERHKKVKDQLLKLDNRRTEVLSFLKDQETFNKFKNYQKNLSKIEAEIARLEEKLESIDKIKDLRDEIRELDQQIEEKTIAIENAISKQDNPSYKKIRKEFTSFINEILNAPAIIFLKTNKAGNVEFNAEIQSADEIEFTSESKGASYKKMLCIAFDMALLVAYSSNSFYRFAYHDGSLEGLDNRKKINYINEIRKKCAKNNLQYIFTAIEDDIPKTDSGNLYIEDKEIAVTLDDTGVEGKLFKMDF